MSCDLSLGRLEPCKDQAGGIKNIYFANYDGDLLTDATLDADDQVTGFASAVTLYKYEVRGNNNSFDEANEVNSENGTSFWTQTLTVALKKQTLADRKELTLLSYGRPHIIVEDYNGNFQLAGFENGCDTSVSTASGSAMGDFRGYNVVATGQESAMAHFVDPAIIDDTTNTTVVVGT